MDTWTTAKGDVLLIKDMSNLHVINVYKHLIRKSENDLQNYPCFGGDMAQYYAQHEYEEINNRNCELLERFIEELESRKLIINKPS